jgi:hypothetical protein
VGYSFCLSVIIYRHPPLTPRVHHQENLFGEENFLTLLNGIGTTTKTIRLQERMDLGEPHYLYLILDFINSVRLGDLDEDQPT